ncbi:MAG: hypothetical protein ACOY3P_02575 [Planctomycetota bacterium]
MKKRTTKMDFFIRRDRASGAWNILDIHSEVLDSGFESEAAAANFIVRFCQDHRMLYAIHY